MMCLEKLLLIVVITMPVSVSHDMNLWTIGYITQKYRSPQIEIMYDIILHKV